MSDYVEKRRIVQAVPIRSDRVVESYHHDAVVNEPSGMSGGVVAALVLSSIALAVLITLLIMTNQQRSTDEQLAQERARAAEAQQQPPQQQQPSVVVVPQSPTTAGPAQAPASEPSAAGAPTNTEIEIDVRSRLLDDQELKALPIEVKASGGVVTLGGDVPNEKLKLQAERLAGKVKGVRSVINNIVVEP